MSISNRNWGLAPLAIAMAFLSACTSTISNVDSNGHTNHPEFPEVSKADHNGSYVSSDNLDKIGSGMNKEQIRELIGPPQFSEGMYGVREWDYVFHFRQGPGKRDKVCQYKVIFDSSMIARSFHYLPTDCR